MQIFETEAMKLAIRFKWEKFGYAKAKLMMFVYAAYVLFFTVTALLLRDDEWRWYHALLMSILTSINLGVLVNECNQLRRDGITDHISNVWNLMDSFAVWSVFLFCMAYLTGSHDAVQKLGALASIALYQG